MHNNPWNSDNPNFYEIFRRIPIGTFLKLALYEGSEHYNGYSNHHMLEHTQSFGANEYMKKSGTLKIMVGQLARVGTHELQIVPVFSGKTPDLSCGYISILYDCIDDAFPLRATKSLINGRRQNQNINQSLDKVVS